MLYDTKLAVITAKVRKCFVFIKFDFFHSIFLKDTMFTVQKKL